MSRNLARSDCYFCHCLRIVYEEPPRPITKEEARVYFDEYEGCTVANAHCYECEARYLAWFDASAHDRRYGWPVHRDYSATQHSDLSFRSTFDDEPGADDLPKYDVVVVRERRPIEVCPDCQLKHAKAVFCGYARRRP